MAADVLVKDTWYVAGLSHEFRPQQLQGRVIAEKPLVLWRTAEGRVVAFDERCCHKRMPLSQGRLIEGGLLECAYHGLCYDEAGRCVRVPSQPDGRIPAQARLRPFPVVEQDGLVWIWTGDPARTDGVRPPRLPEIADPAWETADTGPMPVPANSLLLIENLLDITHFYPLHDGNIGDVENSRIPVRLEQGIRDGSPYVGTVREVRRYKRRPRSYTLYVESSGHAGSDAGLARGASGRCRPRARLHHHPHPHASRPAQPCVAADRQHAGRAEMQIRSDQIRR
jgi:phenylpropionate dioxygenase-like ring-hydroxylating dioxygenase large terminal subunit